MIFSLRISILVLLLMGSAVLVAQTNDFEPTDSTNLKNKVLTPLTLPDSIIDYGKLFLNKPYHYGSKGEKSFDCSGFTTFVYKNFGYNLERSSADQAQQAPTVHKQDIKKGDLVFFEGRRRNGRVGHVGIVVETKDSGSFDFIHAAVGKGVTISNSHEPYYAQRFVKAGRIVGADSLLQRVKCSSDYSNIKSDKTFSVENNASHTIPAVYHKVRKGENLSAIASKYNVTVSQIKRLNNLKSTNLQINQQLKIKEKVTVKVPEQELAQQESIPIKSELLSEKKTDENLDIASSHGSEKHDLNTGEHSKGFEKTNEIRSVSKFHKVTKGETLFSIARANNLSIEKLKEINNLRDGKIMPGQKLLVSVNQNKSVKSEKQSEQKSIEHKVIAGESLFSIANKYNVSVDDIRTANNLSGTKIKVGQMLTIDRVQQSL